jgi:hypothetical protein
MTARFLVPRLLCVVLVFLATTAAFSAAHAQTIEGVDSITGQNNYFGAGTQAFMAVGTDGALAIGPGNPGQTYNTWIDNSPPGNLVYGLGAMNLSSGGVLNFNLTQGFDIGTALPMGMGVGPPYAGFAIAQTPGNSQSIALIIYNPVNDSHTAMAFHNSQKTWELGIGNPAESRYGIADKFYIANATDGNVALVIDNSRHLEINSAANYYGHQLNTLDVAGNMAIGNFVAGLVSAPANGLLVIGSISIGTSPGYSYWTSNAVVGNGPDPTVVFANPNGVSVGLTNLATSGCISSYDTASGGEIAFGIYTSNAGCARSLVMDSSNHVGLGVSPPVNGLDVNGGTTVGFMTCWPGSCGLNATNPVWPTAPPNGLLVGGSVMIGTADPSFPYTNDTGDVLKVNGTAYATGGFSPVSDRRLKQDIEPYTRDALNIVSKLLPVIFSWKQPKDVGMRGRQIGFIAEDVQPIVPQAVIGADTADGMLGLDYDSFVPVLAKAIQDLKADNDSLQNGIKELNARHAALRRQLTSRGMPQRQTPGGDE